MRVKLKVVNHKVVKNEYYLIEFITQYNERLSTFVPNDTYFDIYPLGYIGIFDIVPMRKKDNTLSLRVAIDIKEELF